MKRLFIVLSLLVSQPALAAMSLDKIIVYLTDTPNAREDIVVSNPDSDTLYLQTEVYRVDNPGLPNEERVRVVDPKDFRLLVSPPKTVIPPGEQRRIRMMSLESGLQKEVVYRVNFKPVVGDVTSDRTALKILVGYQVLVFVQPEEGASKLAIKRKDGALYLSNSGNINTEVVEAWHCPSAETPTQDCRELKIVGRLYPGTQISLDNALTNDEKKGGELEVLTRGRDGGRQRLQL
ncbi:hypothetical protein Mag101_04205 [Microbulbifer agarilyticus]|uniref:Pili assembly chaperone N-terminal domain-containing protein n=1 Tax=Microbulbifer agarilyticus TaxID=260552 RepID=A0A1Q2M306_9GAMM|nr:fimbria/pilus periplasmic chaperone [Microbulbifer agarilyticus]AQQ66928.1 hypothetical protein Mag101_04205 [Microbulbifer agarilyticus]